MHAKLKTVIIRLHGTTPLKKKKSSVVVCLLPLTDKPSFTAIQNVYVCIYFHRRQSASKSKTDGRRAKMFLPKCSCSLTDLVRPTVPLLFGTTIDALLGGGRHQLQATAPSDNNARPFGQTVKYTVSCISNILWCSYTDKNTDKNTVQIQNVNIYKANQYNTCNLRKMSLSKNSYTVVSGTYCRTSVRFMLRTSDGYIRLTTIQIRMYVKPLGTRVKHPTTPNLHPIQ